MKPTIGRIVYYRLNASDIVWIEDEMLDRRLHPMEEGQLVAAMIVAVVNEQHCNLRLFFDGEAPSPWVAERSEGEQPGQWSWPPRV